MTPTSFQPLLRWFQAAACAAVLGLLAACGGGGSTGPRFERTSVNNVTGIKDNVTGIIWAAELGTAAGVQPTAAELLVVADLGSETVASNFNFLLNQRVPADEPVVGDSSRAWVVDFRVNPSGVHRLGGLSDEALDNNAPFAQWRILQRPASTIPPVYDLGNGMATQGNLLWSTCSLGTTFNGSVCVGTPAILSRADAQSQAANFRLGSYNDWRLPTKQELQSLLSLGNSQQSLLPAAMSSKDVIDTALPLQYWSSSTYTATTPNSAWIVDFSAENDLGGVELVPTNSTALVRLVRSEP